jgi:hypothetical protein
MAIRRNISYINKDFTELRASLVDYARTYFPTTYNDFSPASPGMMFMEMAAYVGDVLAFYLDNQLQETYLQYARQTNNLYELAYMFGYKPNVTQVATTFVNFYQQVPAIQSGSIYVPDFSFALYIEPNSTVTQNTTNKVPFLIQDPIDFSVSSSGDPTEVTVYEISGVIPTKFLLKKTRKAISSTIETAEFQFGAPVQYSTVEINAEKIVGILDITDKNTGDTWYEVDYLGQEMVYNSIKNTNTNDPNLSQYSGDTPYILKLDKIQRRFVTRFLDSGSLQIQFGAGTANDTDEEIIPNPNNVGIGLPFEQDKLTTAYSPENFLFTKTYGIAPSNTTLVVRYLTGGGAVSNVPANSLTVFTGTATFLNSNLFPGTANTIFNTLGVTNPIAADGGGDGDSIEEIRQNSSANFASQLRNVTQDDYLVRALSMPANYGVISKAYIEPTKAQSISAGESQSVLDLYVLSYNVNNQLTTASTALKQNLTTYLSQYRMVNDSVNIKDAFIINIGVNFSIIILPNYNSNEVLSKCIVALKDYFAINKWAINQPIILRNIYILLDAIEGVQTVQDITINNLVGENLGYSKYAYSIPGATAANVIYPSLDPSIFEVKYPNQDIQGRVVNL